MNIIKYKAFLKTIEFSSLTKAAEYLGYTQPGISHMISSLEKEVGFSLLIRGKEKILPTENAKMLIPFYQQIVSQEEYARDTVNSINNMQLGNIRIASYHSCLINIVPMILQAFSAQYPGIKMHIKEALYTEIHKDLINNYIDMAFMTDNVPPGFDYIPLVKDEIKLIIHPGHPLAKLREVPLSALSSYPFLMPIQDFDDHLKDIKAHEDFHPQVYCQLGSDSAFMSLVAKGIGIAILPESIITSSVFPIVSRSLSPRFFRTLGIVIRSKTNTSPAIQEFLRIAKSTITSSTSDISGGKRSPAFPVYHFNPVDPNA